MPHTYEHALPVFTHTQKAWEHFVAMVFLKWKLHDWDFIWGHGRKMIGSCHYTKKRILVSRHLLSLPDHQLYIMKDTILHEVAHALSYTHEKERGHGPVWKKWCILVGARPQRTYREALPFTHCESKAHKHRYALILEGEESPLRLYYRKPNFKRNIRHYALRGRPETLGKLRLKKLDLLE